MLSLHNKVLILLFLKNINIFIFFFFFLSLILSLIVYFNKYSFKDLNLNFFFFLLIFFFLVYLTKLYIFNRLRLTEVVTFVNFNTQLGDVLISLSFLTTFISLLFLTERFIKKLNFYVIYFYIFSMCTIGMVSTSNLLIMFLYFEFIFLPSLVFVYQFGYSKKAIKTVSFLLSWTFSGSLMVLVSICYLNLIYNSLEMTILQNINYSKFEKNFLFFLFFLGFGIKIPVWPFHYWLTKVHVEAPTGFSIFLSGFLVKTAFFCLANFFWIFYTKLLAIFWLVIIVWGAIDASLRMWSSLDVKRLIAFATVQEMNLIMLFFLLLTNYYTSLLNIFLLMHGILSCFFFFLIDQIQKRYQTRNITSLSGLTLYAPLLTNILWISLLIFRGFPVFLKFLVEWELLFLLIQNYKILGFFFFTIISFFGVLGFSKVWFTILYGQPFFYYHKIDVTKKDFIVGGFLCVTLFSLNFIYLFVASVLYISFKSLQAYILTFRVFNLNIFYIIFFFFLFLQFGIVFN